MLRDENNFYDGDAGAVLHVEAVLGGIFALRNDQPRGSVLHSRRRYL